MLLNNLYVLGYLLIMFLQQIVYGDLINFDVYTTKIKIYLQRSEYLTTSNNIKHNCKRMSSPVLQVFFCLLASLFKYIQPLLSRHFNSIFYFFFEKSLIARQQSMLCFIFQNYFKIIHN